MRPRARRFVRRLLLTAGVAVALSAGDFWALYLVVTVPWLLTRPTL